MTGDEMIKALLSALGAVNAIPVRDRQDCVNKLGVMDAIERVISELGKDTADEQ